jgi:hypothetical protein
VTAAEFASRWPAAWPVGHRVPPRHPGELEEVPLSGIVEPLAPPPVDVAAIALQLLTKEFILLPERLIGGVRLAQGGEQVLDPLLRRVGGGGRVAGSVRRRDGERVRLGMTVRRGRHRSNYRMLTSAFKGVPGHFP